MNTCHGIPDFLAYLIAALFAVMVLLGSGAAIVAAIDAKRRLYPNRAQQRDAKVGGRL